MNHPAAGGVVHFYSSICYNSSNEKRGASREVKIMFDFFNFDIEIFIIRLLAIILSLSVHEFSHGLAAYMLGDSTAKYDGRLSLNPLRHIDPMGLLFLLILGFGWAKPVMVNPESFKDPKQDMALTAFAGPLSNFLLAIVFTLIYVPISYNFYNGVFSGMFLYYLLLFLQVCIGMNIALGIFNMIPIPPLDGSKVFAAVLPDHLYFRVISSSRVTFVILLLLLWTGALSNVLGSMINTVVGFFFNVVGKLYGYY